MDIKQQFVMREVAGEYLLIPVGKTSLDLNGMITLNELGAEIWNMLPEVKDEAEIVKRILDEYDVDEPTATADIAEFLAHIRQLGIIA